MPYKIARSGQPFTESFGVRRTLKRVRTNAKRWGPKHTVWTLDRGWENDSKLPWMLIRLVRRMAKAKHGDLIKTRHGTEREGKPGVVYWIIKVEQGLPLENPPWEDTYLTPEKANPRVKKVAQAAYAFDHEVACLGTLNCRRVSGSSTWSQHAFGNAIDLAFRLPPPVGFDLARQDRLVDYLIGHAEELRIFRLIHREEVWTKGYGWTRYLGQSHTHVHVDFDTQGQGTPPCA